jgi:hypothetical protein
MPATPSKDRNEYSNSETYFYIREDLPTAGPEKAIEVTEFQNPK